MTRQMALKWAAEHGRRRAAAEKQRERRHHEPLFYEPSLRRFVYDDGSPILPDDPRNRPLIGQIDHRVLRPGGWYIAY